MSDIVEVSRVLARAWRITSVRHCVSFDVVTPASPSNNCVELSSLPVIFAVPIGEDGHDVLMTSLVASSWLGEGSSPAGRVRPSCVSYSV
jgi:hypothetical protein